ncbi:alpha/beta hydrolase [Schleiferilactobacillus harbinensis]|uniref:alpha/beta hydrolase n=2 Tax=Schleiferilactobacillus harbinensis TaxID=304207 RepID=UPI0011755F6B|nr:alpha/beta hydrolase [Schleiferilactobacillus harbinensis]MBO3091141.1 alpha/beta hydrolase [Schleiferilactobacillus harbinensis]GEK06572.1 acetylesterase [Schleiferilactobacillus harbinensis]
MQYIEQIITEGTFTAHLTGYVIDNNDEMGRDRTRPAVLIIPGGGYEFVSEREAEPVALKMIGLGYHAFILRYAVYPALYPVALRQAAHALLLIRQNAQAWHIGLQPIIVLGFSAGGHLAASLATMYAEPVLADLSDDPQLMRPDGVALAYAVLTAGRYAHRGSIDHLLGDRDHDSQALAEVSPERHITPDTPPAFLWHTITDDLVPVENALQFTEKLHQNGVSAELHIYPRGGHGLSLGTAETAIPNGYGIEPEVASWPLLFDHWLQDTFLKGVQP